MQHRPEPSPSASSTSQAAREPNASRLADAEAVREVITQVMHTIDAKAWNELRELFADPVSTDYTSPFGGTPQTQSPDALLAGWKAALSAVVTHHQLGPIVVRVEGERATASCHVRAFHYAPAAPGGSTWEVLGRYVFELAPSSPGVWKIRSMTLLLQAQIGNVRLLQEASSSE